MKKLLVLVSLLVLGACSQIPSPVQGSAELRPAFGSPFGTESAEGLAAYANGVYVSGWTDSPLYSKRLGGRDAFLAKYDKAGTLVWGRQFGSAGHDSALDVATDASGNVYIGGVYNAPDPHTATNMLLQKYSASGTRLWSRQYGVPAGSTFGGIAVSGNAVYRAFTSITSSTRDAMLQKYSLSGTLLWSVTFGASTEVGDIAVDAAGNVYATGLVYSPPSLSVFTRKYSPAGQQRWSRTYNNGSYASIKPLGISVAGENVYVGSEARRNANEPDEPFILRFTTGGTFIWARSYLENHRFFGDISALSSGAVFAGRQVGGESVYVTRIRPDGSVVWDRVHYVDSDSSPSYSPEEIKSVLIHPDNTNLFLAGLVDSDALLTRLNLFKGSIIWTR